MIWRVSVSIITIIIILAAISASLDIVELGIDDRDVSEHTSGLSRNVWKVRLKQPDGLGGRRDVGQNTQRFQLGNLCLRVDFHRELFCQGSRGGLSVFHQFFQGVGGQSADLTI